MTSPWIDLLCPLVLASRSPRRTAILAMLGIEHEVDPPGDPEPAWRGEPPEDFVIHLAAIKSGEVARRQVGRLVLGADTVVVLDGRVLGKPADPTEARSMLLSLSGRTHRVFTGLCLRDEEGQPRTRLETADVIFRSVTPEAVERYVATGDPLDKAGAYGIQSVGAGLVASIRGCFHTVAGLPVAATLELLASHGRNP